MSGVVIVDWLGRGGIAQCTEAWSIELREQGIDTWVVTRAGRELSSTGMHVGGESVGGRLATHRGVALRAADTVRELRPSAVVIQNYIAPPLERSVHKASEAVGARVIRVVHDHRLHSPWAGTRVGLRSQLRSSDVILAHSQFVARAVRRMAKRAVEVIPHPVQLGMLALPAAPSPLSVRSGDRRLALHFGILHRRYKGTNTIVALAREQVPGWSFAAIGVGAPEAASGLDTVARFVGSAELIAAIQEASATLLPYRFATQSGAVVLSQALGTIPITTAVGGLPEQVGRGGIVLPRESSVEAWIGALARLNDPGRRAEMIAKGKESVWSGHHAGVRRLRELVAGR